MTTTSATSGTAADVYANLNGSSSTKKATTTAGDMENRFLTLLTTQLKNQDPLNPLDNAQVTSQLAQINTVNGIEKLNTTMSQLMSSYGSTQTMQAASMIGSHVLTPGANMTLKTGQAIAGIKLDGNADHVNITIKDSTGKIVQTSDLGANKAGTFNFVWDGKNDAKEALADGEYTFTVEATQDGKAVTAKALQLGTVNAVTMTSSGFVLDLGARGTAAFSDVQQIL